MFASMANLKNLCRLELAYFIIDVVSFDNADLPNLTQLLKLKLTSFFMKNGFDAVAFCRVLSRLFPNLEELTLKVLRSEDREAIRQCYGQFFSQLQKLDVTVIVPKKRRISFDAEDVPM